jgi:hypothetical protein
MEISAICKFVNEKLDSLSTGEQVNLYKEIFRYPISYEEGKYFYSSFEWDETQMKDFLAINKHWLNPTEYSRLFYFFDKRGI